MYFNYHWQLSIRPEISLEGRVRISGPFSKVEQESCLCARKMKNTDWRPILPFSFNKKASSGESSLGKKLDFSKGITRYD